MARSKTRTAIYPFAYMGTEASTPPNFTIDNTRAPTNDDYAGYQVGALWLWRNEDTPPASATYSYEVWMLVKLDGKVATWVWLYPAIGADGIAFNADTGQAVPVAGEVNVFGDGIWVTSASGNTVTNALDTLGTDGQLLIGSTAGSNAWGSITSSGGTVTIGTGANTLNLEASDEGGAITFETDSDDAVVDMGEIQLLGGSNINTSGATNVVTINLNNNVVIPGMLTVQTLGRGVVQSSATGVLSASEGTDGQLLISSSSGAPSWANITSTDGSVTITNGANSIDLSYTGAPVDRQMFLATLPFYSEFFSGGTSYQTLVSNDTVNKIFDIDANVYPGPTPGMVFTAPDDGRYFLQCLLKFQDYFTGPPPGDPLKSLRINTSNRTYTLNGTDRSTKSIFIYEILLSSIFGDTLADMDAGDTALFQAFHNNPARLDLLRGEISGFLVSRT